ncbi:hypothetical protein TSOC_014758, partial [Tetrabaena socialis]
PGGATGKELPVQGVDSAALETVLGYFYRGECLLSPATAVPIYDVCLKLEVPGLSAACEQYIQTNMNPHTCPVFLDAAVQLLLEHTQSMCLAYAASRFDDVVASPSFQALSGESVRLLLTHTRPTVGDVGLARALARWAVQKPEHLGECEAMFQELNITASALLQLLQSPEFVSALQPLAAPAARVGASGGAAPPLEQQQQQQQQPQGPAAEGPHGSQGQPHAQALLFRAASGQRRSPSTSSSGRRDGGAGAAPPERAGGGGSRLAGGLALGERRAQNGGGGGAWDAAEGGGLQRPSSSGRGAAPQPPGLGLRSVQSDPSTGVLHRDREGGEGPALQPPEGRRSGAPGALGELGADADAGSGAEPPARARWSAQGLRDAGVDVGGGGGGGDGLGPLAARGLLDAVSGGGGGGGGVAGNGGVVAVPLPALEQAGLVLTLQAGALVATGGALGPRQLPLRVVPSGPGAGSELLALLPAALVRGLHAAVQRQAEAEALAAEREDLLQQEEAA